MKVELAANGAAASSIGWAQALHIAVNTLPYIAAVTAFVQSWMAMSAARSASRQVSLTRNQLQLLQQQVAMEAQVAMNSLEPQFDLHASTFQEVGTQARDGDGCLVFIPLDDSTRRHPDLWRRRRTLSVTCVESPGPLIATIRVIPSTVTLILPPAEPLVAGSTLRAELLLPVDLDPSTVHLTIITHLPSEPGKSWVRQLKCFGGD